MGTDKHGSKSRNQALARYLYDEPFGVPLVKGQNASFPFANPCPSVVELNRSGLTVSRSTAFTPLRVGR
jgi:hypothetical protein